jgi:DNA-binding LacI/PurR family transcriptional regulator
VCSPRRAVAAASIGAEKLVPSNRFSRSVGADGAGDNCRFVTSEQNGRATIFEVAEAAGVSITTVSHVFSGNRRVREETRRRVLETAERLVYRPRATARGLATGRTNTLALQVSISGESLVLNPFFSSLLASLSLAAIDRGYSFVFVPPESAGRGFIDPLLVERRVDGAILVDPVKRDPFVRAVLSAGIAYVSIGRILGVKSDRWVDNDHRAASVKVVAHLKRAGYRRPALLTVPFDVSYIVDCTDGFRSATGEAGQILEAVDMTEAAAHRAAGQALRADEPPDAFFCVHDRLAVGALAAAAEHGVAVPDELGVVGVGDFLAQHGHPPLTSVRVFPERVGAIALDRLDVLLRGGDAELPGIVPNQLVRRTSTARAR